MKKKLLFMIVIVMMALAGCSTSDNSNDANQADNQNNDAAANQNAGEQQQTAQEKADLTLQLLKVDEESGVTIEDNPIYSGLQSMIEKNPKLGTDKDFSVHTVNIFHSGDEAALVLMLVNRIGTPIKNVSFDLSIGEKDGDYIWENTKIDLPEDKAGILQSNSAVPLIMKLTKEKEKQLKQLDQQSLTIKVTNFKFKEA